MATWAPAHGQSFPAWRMPQGQALKGGLVSPVLPEAPHSQGSEWERVAHLWAHTYSLSASPLHLILLPTLPCWCLHRVHAAERKHFLCPRCPAGVCYLEGQVSLWCRWLLQDCALCLGKPAGFLEAGMPCGQQYPAGPAAEAWSVGRLGLGTSAT